MHYPFDLQLYIEKFDTNLDLCHDFLKTAIFEEKINMLAFLIVHQRKFNQQQWQSLIKAHFPVAYFLDSTYNSMIESYFLEGKSGMLYLLLQLEDLVEDISYATVIESFFKTLLFQLQLSPMCCVYDGQQQQSPVGFYKGNSGIAYTFLLLADYYNNKEIAKVSKSLCLYEDIALITGNYHTYQSPIENEEMLKEFKENYLQKNTAFFNQREQSLTSQDASHMFYTRIQWCQTLNESPNIEVLEKLIQHIEKTNESSTAVAACKKIVNDLRQNINIQQISTPFSESTIASKSTSDFTFDAFLLQQVSIAFRRTLVLFNTLEVSITETFKTAYFPLKNLQTDIFKCFYEHCKMHIQTQKETHRKCLLEILDFEYETVVMQQQITNPLWLQLEDIVNVHRREKLLMLDETAFLKTELQTNPSGKLIKTDWNWITQEIFERLFKVEVNLEAESNEFYCFKIPLGTYNLEKKTNFKEIVLSEYEYILLDLFEYKVAIHEVIKEFSTIFDVENQEDFQRVHAFTKEIIKTLIFKKCLI